MSRHPGIRLAAIALAGLLAARCAPPPRAIAPASQWPPCPADTVPDFAHTPSIEELLFVPPRAINQPEVDRAFKRHYASGDRVAGRDGTTTVTFWVLPDGTAANLWVYRAARRPELDTAALAVATVMRFEPGLAPDPGGDGWCRAYVRYFVELPPTLRP